MTGCVAPAARGQQALCGAPVASGGLCAEHARAPGVQRGGWLSAERRRRRRVGAGDPVAWSPSNIAPRLWLSAMPPLDRDLPGFDVLVLCAGDTTGDRLPFRGKVLRCPLPATLGIYDIRRVINAAGAVAGALRAGRTVLVACATGHDGSALVAGMGLGMATRMAPPSIVSLLRQRRSAECLGDPGLVQVLDFYLRRRK